MPSRILRIASRSSTDTRVCLVISNWTGLPVFPLNDRRAVAQLAANAYIVDLQADEVAASKFAVNRQIEHYEIAPARIDLKESADISDFLWFKRALLSNESSLVPRWLLMVSLLVEGFGHGRDLLVRPLPPHRPALSWRKDNVRASLKLQIANSGRSKWPMAARSAPEREFTDGWPKLRSRPDRDVPRIARMSCFER